MTTIAPRRNVFSRLVIVMALTSGLIACSQESEPQPAVTATPTTAPAPAPAEAEAPAEAVQAITETPEETAKRAGEAVDAQRLFAPAGDNAFELYLSVLDAKPDDPLARNALTDLFPYAVMHVEQRLKSNDPDDAERVLALMEKANPQAPALPRLRTDLTDMRTRIAAAEQAEAQRAERAQQQAAAEAAARAAQPAAPATPAPEPTPVTTPPPAATTPTPAPAPAPTETAPVAAEPTPPPAAAPRRPAGLPPVVNQVSPRYPPLALRRRVEGFVEVQFTVLADGTVTDVSVLRSEPRSMFDREAISAMQRWRFQAVPGAEPQRGRRTFDFKLTD